MNLVKGLSTPNYPNLPQMIVLKFYKDIAELRAKMCKLFRDNAFINWRFILRKTMSPHTGFY